MLAWEGLPPTFSGKVIVRAGWEIYIAEFERLARHLVISEEEKFRRLFETVPQNFQESIQAQKVVLAGVPAKTKGSQVQMMVEGVETT